MFKICFKICFQFYFEIKSFFSLWSMVLLSFAYNKINLIEHILFTYIYLEKLYEIKIGLLCCYS